MSEVTSLFYPEQQLNIGSYQLTKGVELTVTSAVSSYYDWAKIKLIKALEDKITISKLDKAEISLGYDGSFNKVFRGYVYDTGSADREIILKDDMLRLEAKKISHTFVDAEPCEVIAYCLGQAGVSSYKLFGNKFPRRSMFPVVQKSVLQVLEDIKRIWKIEDLFFFREGVFYWGQQPTQEKVYTFDYGNNIISLAKEKNEYILETASVPFIHHSDYINVEHPKVSGEKQISKVKFKSNGNGFLRTKLYFEG